MSKFISDELYEICGSGEDEMVKAILKLIERERVEARKDELLEIRDALLERKEEYLDLIIATRYNSLSPTNCTEELNE